MIAIKAYNDHINPNRPLTPTEQNIEKYFTEGMNNNNIPINQEKIETPVTKKYSRKMFIKETIAKVGLIGLLAIHGATMYLFKNISTYYSLDI